MSKKLMVLGTASTVGKSILVAALCRILNDEGHKVAPFKSQNMALNSYITKDGKEMGRAQVVQAEAARVEPTVDMNPILLKPTSYVGSQVILMGKVHKNMKAMTYFRNKTQFIPHIEEAFSNLEKDYEYIVIEGAGSPAEINLRENDIVNMGLAEIVDSDVILVGDVDRGGVFASLYGTYMLLEESEQKRVKGFIINKFRGDKEILMPGIKMLEDKIHIPCVGVVPFIEKLDIDDEDSVSVRIDEDHHEAQVIIGVVRLPYMSNFTDFTCFDIEGDIALNYVTTLEGMKKCDALIIPGSKNTIADMSYIVNSGLEKGIYEHVKQGKMLFGICGGYQILGESIHDPEGVEGEAGLSVNGLGLLPVETTLTGEKTTTQIEGCLLNTGSIEADLSAVKGYEIHMGVTKAKETLTNMMKLEDGRLDGHIHNNGHIMGTYLHGVFDNDDFRRSFIDYLFKEKGLEAGSPGISFEEHKNNEYQRLGDLVKDNVDMDMIKEFFR